MRTSSSTMLFWIMSGAVCAQPASEGIRLDLCLQTARDADSICSDSANDAAKRADCLQKARTSLLECLEPKTSRDSFGIVSPKSPAIPVAPSVPADSVAPDRPSQSDSADTSTATDAVGRPAVSLQAPFETPESPAPTVRPDEPSAALLPDKSPQAVDPPGKRPDSNWILSETTSPVDYTAVFTAVIRATSIVKNGPQLLAVRCRGPHTGLMLRTDGTWRSSPANDIQVDYQINDQPHVKLPWTVSPDGRTANYRGDAAALLQSFPDGARLKINVLYGAGPGHEATFRLGGLANVRKKMRTVCQRPPSERKISSEKR
jgi:hypothetical protein